jgi:hypothetical protein
MSEVWELTKQICCNAKPETLLGGIQVFGIWCGEDCIHSRPNRLAWSTSRCTKYNEPCLNPVGLPQIDRCKSCIADYPIC